MNVKEIFFSYQGEGPYIGSPTLFIRFAGCNLNCYYCDTKYAKSVTKQNNIEPQHLANKILKYLKKYKPEFISLTGGEPLLQKQLPDFLKEIVKYKNFKIYLETNASLVRQFHDVINFIDVCAINLKIPEDDINRKNVITNTQKIVNLCKKNNKEFFIKITICGRKLYNDYTLKRLQKFLVKTKPKSLVLQPETSSLKKKSKTLFFNITKIFKLTKKYVPIIYIIPQLHRIIYKIR